MDNDSDNRDSSSPIGRSLGDIRIHDSAQAGELVRRLGARAFTVGRDIYVRSDLVNQGTPEGEALLAHEITHAVEQTGGSVNDMPLLRPQAYRNATSSGSSGQGGSGGGMNVQRAAASRGASPASLPASEARAEATEASTMQSARGAQSGGGGGGARQAEPENTQSAQQPNVEEIAERVYELMRREMIIDIERSANL